MSRAKHHSNYGDPASADSNASPAPPVYPTRENTMTKLQITCSLMVVAIFVLLMLLVPMKP